MKKTALNLSISCVLGAASFAVTAAPGDHEWKFYTRLYPQIYFSDYSNATAPGGATATFAQNNSGTNFKSENKIDDSSSRMGFRGSVDAGNGIKGIWQLEFGLDIDERAGDVVARDSYVGIQSSLGTIILGNARTAFRRATGDKVGFLGVNAGNLVSMSNLLTQVGQSGNSRASFHLRERNTIQYWSPDLNGLSFKAHYSSREEENSSSLNREVLSFGAEYEGDNFELGIGYEVHNDFIGGSRNAGFGSGLRGASSEDTGIRVAGAYEFGKTTVGLVYERLEYTEDGNATAGAFDSYDRDGWWLSAEHKLTKKLRMAAYYGQADDGSCSLVGGVACTTSGLGATAYGIGARYDIAKDFRVFAFYAVIDNDKSGTYTMLDPDDDIPAAGTKESAIALGIYYRFR